MPTKLGCLSLCSEFSCEGHVNVEMSRSACYGRALNLWRNETRTPKQITWTIRIRKLGTPEDISDYNNFCLMKKEEIEAHLEYCKNTYGIDFEYNIVETTRFGKGCFVLTVGMNRRKTEQKFVLTWIRHLYEFPFNMFMLDALKLKNEEKEFEEEHLVNILQVVGSTYTVPEHESNGDFVCRQYRSDQCLCTPFKKLVSIEEIKEHNTTSDLITSSYSENQSKADIIHYKDESGAEVQETLTLEYWQNPDTWEERRQAYLDNYKVYKK